MRYLSLCLGGLLIGLLGCSRVEYATVEGKVTRNNKPLADVCVQFVPELNQASSEVATAYTDAEGRYRILAQGQSGVVVGSHTILLSDARIMAGGAGGVDTNDGMAPGAQPAVAPTPRSRIPNQYSNASTTPLKNRTVEAGGSTHNIDLP